MLTSFALIFLCGIFLGGVCKKIKLPPLIGMLIAGILLGPYVFDLLDGGILAASDLLRKTALVIILARAGLSLDIEDLKRIGRSAVFMSFVPACFEMFGTILIAPKLLNIPILDAALLAAVIASASPAVIVPRMIKLKEEGYGTNKLIPQLILAGDSVDDIFNIVVFTSFLGLRSGEKVSVWQFGAVPVAILSGVAIGVAAGFLLSGFFKKINARNSVKVIVLLSIAFLLVGLEDKIESFIPFSGLLSVMAIGIVILKKVPKTAEKISKKLSKLWVCAEVLLFVLVGAGVSLKYAAVSGIRIILMIIAVLIMRGVGISLCLIKTPLNAKERLFCMLSGIPKATVQAAIGGIPLAMGLPCGEIILAAAVVAILFTAPLGAFLLDISYKKLLTKGNDKI